MQGKDSLGAQKGVCWLQEASGYSYQVQINVKCHERFQNWSLFAGGCSSQVVV